MKLPIAVILTTLCILTVHAILGLMIRASAKNVKGTGYLAGGLSLLATSFLLVVMSVLADTGLFWSSSIIALHHLASYAAFMMISIAILRFINRDRFRTFHYLWLTFSVICFIPLSFTVSLIEQEVLSSIVTLVFVAFSGYQILKHPKSDCKSGCYFVGISQMALAAVILTKAVVLAFGQPTSQQLASISFFVTGPAIQTAVIFGLVLMLSQRLLTQQHVQQVRLKQQGNRIKKLQEASGSGIAIIKQTQISDSNSKLTELTTLGRKKLTDYPVVDLFSEEHQNKVLNALKNNDSSLFDAELQLEAQTLPVEVRFSSYQHNGCDDDERAMEVRDISKRKELELYLTMLASHDELTGALNRRAFFMQMEKLIYRPSMVFLLDLDHFKQINDNYGHSAGDTALQEFVQTVKVTLPEGAYMGRLGGEEFALTLENTELMQALDVAEKLHNSIRELDIIYKHQTIKLTVSIGIAQWLDANESIDHVLHKADQALYLAKDKGRDQTQVWRQTLASESSQNVRMQIR